MPDTPKKLSSEKAARDDLYREFWVVLSPGLFVTVVGFILALSFVGSPPPKTLRFASGSSWGAYNKYAQLYKQELAGQGLNIEVLETKGSTENLKLLVEGKADIAFVQGGIKSPDPNVHLLCLGSVYYEPLWVFVKGDKPVTTLAELSGKRVAIGPEGSGTRAIAVEMLEDAEVMHDVDTLDAGGETAEKMLHEGRADAVFFIGSPTIPAIKRLLRAPGIQLMQFRHAKALERRHQFLSTLPLYEGVVDLKHNIPDRDIQLLAPAATLVVREGFHKALPSVILSAAKDIHGQGSMLNEAGAFPSPLFCSFPIDTEAKHYYERGLSLLYRHLPFYVASGLDRMGILLLPFVGLLVPIIRLLPPVYNWTMKRKIYQRYRMLQRLENKVGLIPHEDLIHELSEIEAAAKKLASMPPAYGADIYALRSNLERVRDRIHASQGGTPKLTLASVDRSMHRKPGKDSSDSETEESPLPPSRPAKKRESKPSVEPTPASGSETSEE